MKMKIKMKRMSGILLSIALVFGMLPGMGTTVQAGPASLGSVHSHDDLTFQPWEQTDSLPNSEGNYYLKSDVTLTGTWNVPAGTNNLCLNGHMITNSFANGSETPDGNIIHIAVGNTLTIFDEGSGKIAGVNYYHNVAGSNIYVNGINCEGTFVMNGGTINVGDSAKGVSVSTTGNFTMNAGQIKNCGWCGVSVSGGHFTMNGGTISENTCGVSVSGEGIVSLSGSPVIDGNGSGETVSNLTLKENGSVQITGELANGVDIGIRIEKNEQDGFYDDGDTPRYKIVSTGVFTTGIASAEAANAFKTHFTSDAGYDVLVDSDTHQLKLGLAPISYIDHDTNGTAETKTCESYTSFVVGHNSTLTTIAEGWYVIKSGSAVAENRLIVEGEVNLILCDDALLYAAKGITVASGKTLNIYAGSTGETIEGTGALFAIATDATKCAGIGGGDGGAGGTVNIHGGNVSAEGGRCAAGIGGGNSAAGGMVNIHGGNIDAVGGEYAAGIGGGFQGAGGTVNIYNGMVTAAGGSEAPQGIGHGKEIEGSGTLTVADALAVFGGNSENPSTEIQKEDNDYARSKYMTVAVPHKHETGTSGADITFAPWNDTNSLPLPVLAGSYYLTRDVVLDSSWHVPAGVTNLCLDGHNICARQDGFSVIIVDNDATLNLYDKADDSGKILGARVDSGTGGGGVYIIAGGTFNMHGGTITDNAVFGMGGGVYVAGNSTSNGTFNMFGGMITGNVADNGGGGVCVDGIFSMSGGTITGNTSLGYDGGGVLTLSTGTFNISGNPNIAGNKKGAAANNVYLGSEKVINVIGALASGANIGVTKAGSGTGIFTAGIADATTANTYKGYFTSDAGNAVLVDSESSQLKLVQKTAATVAAAPAAKSLTYTGSAQALVTAGVAEGGTMYYALGENDATAPEADAEGTPDGQKKWITSIPVGTDTGTYYVWYQVIGDDDHLDTDAACVTVKIKSTSSSQSYTPSSSSTSSSSAQTEAYTIPVSNENTVDISTNISGGNAVVQEITQADIDKITEISTTGDGTAQPGSTDTGNDAGSGEKNSITIDVSGAKSAVNSVELSGTSMEKLADAVEKSEKVDSVEIKMTDATVELDGKAVSAVSEQVEGSSVKLVVEDTKETTLSSEQQESLKQFSSVRSFQAYFTSGGKEIHDFKGGIATVSLRFTPDAGKDAKHYHVYYLPLTGAIERYLTRLIGEWIVFKTGHFSDYAIVYDETIENETGKPEEAAEPTATPVPVETPIPTATPGSTATPEAAATQVPTGTPAPTATPGTAATPRPTATPAPGTTQPPSAAAPEGPVTAAEQAEAKLPG